MKRKIWLKPTNTKKKNIEHLSKETALSPITVAILHDRGLDTAKSILEYFSDEPQYNPPNLLKDNTKASKRILSAIKNNENILIYGDYDVDGICSTSLLFRFLKEYLGATNIEYFIPERLYDGYGLNTNRLIEFVAKNTNLLISVDCGISNFEAVQAVLGKMDIIITDHHQVPDCLPESYAIVNPQQHDCQYPFKKLSGAGVAFKLCQQLWQLYNNDDTIFFEDFLELVALATVADIVPLTNENRCIVKRGLIAINSTKLPGIKALFQICGLTEQKVSATTLGFQVAPRINAVGRLGNAKIAVELLTTNNLSRALEIAEFLNQENANRQAIESKILQLAEKKLTTTPPQKSIILADAQWNVGVIGIVSSKLVDKYYLPTILFSIDKNGIAKGSGRSIHALDLYKALSSMQHLFLSFGGHHQAAGMSLRQENLPEFIELFNKYIEENLSEEDFIPNIRIDYEIEDFSELNSHLLSELELFEPCGFGNTKPKLSTSTVSVKQAWTFSDGQHLRLQFQKNSLKRPATMWKHGELVNEIKAGNIVDIAFNLTLDNRQDLSLNMLDIHPLVTLSDFRYTQQLAKPYIDQSINNSKIICTYGALDTEKPTANILSWSKQKSNVLSPINTFLLTAVPSHSDFLEIKDFIQNNKTIEEVIFSFDINSVNNAMEMLNNQEINREHMVNFFLYLKNKYQTIGQISVELISAEKAFSLYLIEKSLSILQELSLISIDKGFVILLPTNNKKDLSESKILTNLNNELEAERLFLNDLKRKTMVELLGY